MSAHGMKGVLAWKRIILIIVVLLFSVGMMSWFSTPREEDPRLKDRNGLIKVIFPGATSSDVRKLVVKPIEDELTEIDGIKTVVSKARAEFALFEITLKDSVATPTEIDEAWKKTQDAIDRAKRKFPETVLVPELDRDLFDQDAVLLSLTGDGTKLDLLDDARDLKDRLRSIPSVKKIDTIASAGEQLTIVLPDEISRKLGLSLPSLIGQLRAGNASIPAGYVRMGDRKVNILTNSFFKSDSELQKFPIALKSGEIVTLGSIAGVSRTIATPESETMFVNGKTAIGIGVVPGKGANLQDFGKDIRAEVRRFSELKTSKTKNMKISEVNFQPDYVDARIFEISKKLLLAVVLVGGALFLMLGARVGLIVAAQVPIVTLISFGLFSMSGGVLHQISLVAFILAIGLLVDNVVVMVDGVQDKLDRGFSPAEAAEKTIEEYWIPLAAGTLSTIAAFVPILLAKGGPADFVRSIGEVAAIALLASYLFCVFATPVFAAWVLKAGTAKRWNFVMPLGEKLGSIVARFPKGILATAFVLVLVSGFGFTFVEKQFFPFADRNQLIVDLQMPEGTHFKTTLEESKKVENLLRADRRVKSITAFVGRGVPLFYYNLPRQPNAPHIAQFIVQTADAKDAKLLKEDVEKKLRQAVPYGVLNLKEIAQGPPVKAPIEVRVMSHDVEKLVKSSVGTLKLVRTVPGVDNARSDLGVGTININYDINDSANANFGLTRADITGVILSRTRGLPVTEFRGSDDPYKIVIQSEAGEESSANQLSQAYVGQTRTADIRVNTVTSRKIQFLPSVINHRNRVPTVTILTELAPGAGENEVAARVKAALATFSLEPGVKIEMGGATSEASDANKSIFLALPIGLFILLVSLMFEFNSLRRVGIILVTIPLCAVGTVPGLLLSGSTFGFMTLLGCLALAGTVIHNGIFLLDYINHRQADDIALDQAITEGIQRRTRPIILTAVATIVELIPLTLTKATLWPPFAWAIISGLAISTLLTLLVVPALYKVIFQNAKEEKPGREKLKSVGMACFGAVIFFLQFPNSYAAEIRTSLVMSLTEIVEKSSKGPEVFAAKADADAIRYMQEASFRGTYFPKLGAGAQAISRDRDLQLGTPFGPLKQGNSSFQQVGVELKQPIFDPVKMLYEYPSIKAGAEAQDFKAKRAQKENQFQAVQLYLQVHEIRSKKKALEQFSKTLQRRLVEFRRLLEIGRMAEADYLRIKLGIDDANEGIKTYAAKESFLGRLMGRLIGEDLIIVPEDLPPEMPGAEPEKTNEPFAREDLAAMKKQMESIGLKAKAEMAQSLPKLEIFVNYTFTNQEQLVQKDWVSGGLRLTWVAFDGGARYEKDRAALQEELSVENKLRSAELALEAEISDSKEMLRQKRDEVEIRRQSIHDARKAVELEASRFKQGRSTVNDLIDAEEVLRDRTEKLDLSRIAWYQEWFRIQSAQGVTPQTPW